MNFLEITLECLTVANRESDCSHNSHNTATPSHSYSPHMTWCIPTSCTHNSYLYSSAHELTISSMNQTIYSYSTYSQSILSTAMNNLIYDHTHNLQSQLPIHTCLNHTIIVATHVTKITAFKCIIIIITVNFCQIIPAFFLE